MTQEYIDNVVSIAKVAIIDITFKYVKMAENSIYNQSLLKDATNLHSFIRELEDYPLDYFTDDDQYIYDLERLTRKYCSVKAPIITDPTEESGDGGSGNTNLTLAPQQRYYFTPLGSSGDHSPTDIIVPVTPQILIMVTILTGLNLAIGDGVKTTECYFTDDDGDTAKTLATIAAGDELYYNGTVMGVELDGTETIELLII
jgi:hypothetical protein